MYKFYARFNERAWLASGCPHTSPPFVHPCTAHVSPTATARKHMEPTPRQWEPLRIPAPDTEARQQKGEERDATLNLVLKHPDATIAIYV